MSKLCHKSIKQLNLRCKGIIGFEPMILYCMLAFKASALTHSAIYPTLYGKDRIRTYNRVYAKHLLYQFELLPQLRNPIFRTCFKTIIYIF